MDTWTIWQLTGGKVHKTDCSNASRTQLFNIHTMEWDPELCRIFDIPMSVLPQVCGSDGEYGQTDLGGLLDHPVPIRSAIGDSHASLFGHGCVERGDCMACLLYTSYPKESKDWDEHPWANTTPGASTFQQVADRLLFGLRRIAREVGDGNALCVDVYKRQNLYSATTSISLTCLQENVAADRAAIYGIPSEVVDLSLIHISWWHRWRK